MADTMPDTTKPTMHPTWARRITWFLFGHLPATPYPSNHPSGLRRPPIDVRG